MLSPPTGTVTFLFTDIEGSTMLIQRLGDRYAQVLVDCRRLLQGTAQERGGQEVDPPRGDACFIAFPGAKDVAAAVPSERNGGLSRRIIQKGSVQARCALVSRSTLQPNV